MRFQRIYVGLAVKLRFVKKFLFLLITLVTVSFAQAQYAAYHFISTDSLLSFGNVEKSTLLYIDSSAKKDISTVAGSAFIPLTHYPYLRHIPSAAIPFTFYLKFRVKNPSDHAVKLFHYPGKLFKEIDLFVADSGGIFTPVKTGRIFDGFVPLSVKAGTTVTFIVRLKCFKVHFNALESKLIAADHLNIFKNELFQTLNSKKIAGMILSGMLMMMILVTLLNFFIIKKIEFLYSSGYSLCMFLLIFFTTYLTLNPGWFKGFFIAYFDLLLLITGTVSYLAFTRYFLDTAQLHPRLNSFLKYEAWALVLLMGIYTVVFFGTNTFIYENYLENLMKIIMIVAALVYIFLSLVEHNPLMNYLAVGVLTQIFFSIVSLILVLSGAKAQHIFDSPIFYFEVGIICSIIFFLLGVFYKNRQELILRIQEQEAMKLEVERQSFENKITVIKTQQEERNRISADMHDDLGAGMTSIRLYSELAKTKLGEKSIPELDKISGSADELINNMNAIIWSMASQNDSMGNMVAYIRSYAIQYLENTNIKPFVSIPEHLPALVVNGTIRRNVFLVIKEALQNVVKHSGATELHIVMQKEPDGYSLVIHDNGKGIDFDKLRPFSNGLKNMRKRMKDVNIEFSIERENGTRIRLFAKTR